MRFDCVSVAFGTADMLSVHDVVLCCFVFLFTCSAVGFQVFILILFFVFYFLLFLVLQARLPRTFGSDAEFRFGIGPLLPTALLRLYPPPALSLAAMLRDPASRQSPNISMECRSCLAFVFVHCLFVL